mmetsp:Transcript_10821/g.39685  ORF Transcript_10821/g.39685 Transcript_10821/m.39685 type:complete len:209 (-) Transcript_10821:1051-1677(-)
MRSFLTKDHRDTYLTVTSFAPPPAKARAYIKGNLRFTPFCTSPALSTSPATGSACTQRDPSPSHRTSTQYMQASGGMASASLSLSLRSSTSLAEPPASRPDGNAERSICFTMALTGYASKTHTTRTVRPRPRRRAAIKHASLSASPAPSFKQFISCARIDKRPSGLVAKCMAASKSDTYRATLNLSWNHHMRGRRCKDVHLLGLVDKD